MMFHMWHVLAIIMIFALGFILGDMFKRKRVNRYFYFKYLRKLEKIRRGG